MKVVEARQLYKKFIIDINPLTMFNLLKRIIKPQKHYMEIYALKDINFEAFQGDRIALIGDNGSGKTTLLRLIAGLYKKTEGSIYINGDIAAFLQLGIGMERNLSALENIFLFGAIMGLERKEIKSKLDDIAEFAEIENFLHCPIRDFSTGMVQRLAFSIARFVKTEIILLDDLFVSTDIGFRERCYSVFEHFVNNSKTIMFTSHDIGIIRKFCNKALLLDEGNQIVFGPTEEVLDIYRRNKNL